MCLLEFIWEFFSIYDFVLLLEVQEDIGHGGSVVGGKWLKDRVRDESQGVVAITARIREAFCDEAKDDQVIFVIGGGSGISRSVGEVAYVHKVRRLE